MKIVADMSLYPLKDGPIPDIIEFIEDLRERAGIDDEAEGEDRRGAEPYQLQ